MIEPVGPGVLDRDPLWRQAELHASKREWVEAIQCFKALLARSPTQVEVLVQLSYVESLAGHYRAARDYALQAQAGNAADTAILGELIARLRTFNEATAIFECIDRLPPLEQLDIALLITLGAQLSYLNQQERALVFLDEAKRADPFFPPTLLARAQVLIYLGRFQEAEADLTRSIKRAPEIAQSYALLSKLRSQTIQQNHVPQIRKLLSNPGRRTDDTALLGFALHKELDDLGEYPGAWQALMEGCSAKRARLKYSSTESRALVSDLMGFQVLARTARLVASGRRVPVFIVGMHRSGTTLLEQLLSGHDDVKGIGELYDFTSAMRYATDHHCRGVIDSTIVQRARGIDFGEVGSRYLTGIDWRLGAERYFTDKLPSNFLNIGFICEALPQAKILHMVRDPIETCFSNLRELFSDANPYSYDQIELADYFHQYERLMRHWHAAYPGRILDVDYGELTRDPERALREVCTFCLLEFEPGMLDLSARTRGVATASAVQVREKVAAREKPKWDPYAENLQPMIRRLKSGHATDQR